MTIKHFARERLGSSKVCLLVVFALAWLEITPKSQGADSWQSSFPIQLRADRRSLASTIHLKCRFLQNLSPTSGLQAFSPDTVERSFYETLTAINDGDLAQCRKLASRDMIRDDNEFTNLIRAYRSSFDLRPEQLKSLGRVEVGTNVFFLWETDPLGTLPSSSRLARNFFRFERSAADGFYWKENRSDVLAKLFRSTLQASANHSDLAAHVLLKSSQFEYSIPSTTNGRHVILQFNGKVYDVHIDETEADPKDDVLNFYRKAFRLFQDSKGIFMEEFAECYTEDSRKKFSDWFRTKRSDEIAAFKRDTLQARRFVSFVIDASPIYIVFYRPASELSSGHRYDYLLRDPASGKLQLTNFYFQSFFDDFLNVPDNFEHPFLIPTLAARKQASKETRHQLKSTP